MPAAKRHQRRNYYRPGNRVRTHAIGNPTDQRVRQTARHRQEVGRAVDLSCFAHPSQRGVGAWPRPFATSKTMSTTAASAIIWQRGKSVRFAAIRAGSKTCLRGGAAPRLDGLGAVGRLSGAVPRAAGPDRPLGRHRPRTTDHRCPGAPDSRGKLQGSDHGDQSRRWKATARPCTFRICWAACRSALPGSPAESPAAACWSLPIRKSCRRHDRPADVLEKNNPAAG